MHVFAPRICLLLITATIFGKAEINIEMAEQISKDTIVIQNKL